MAKNDETEFTAFVQRHSRFVFRVAYAILRNAHDAEDIGQETFLKLYRKQTWRGIKDERAFLARVTWRMAIDRLPKRDTSGNQESDLPSLHHDPEQLAISSDLHSRIHRLVDALPEELRQPLALSTIEELTSREIAEALGIPEGTVRTRIMRARQLLREKIAVMEGGRHAQSGQ